MPPTPLTITKPSKPARLATPATPITPPSPTTATILAFPTTRGLKLSTAARRALKAIMGDMPGLEVYSGCTDDGVEWASVHRGDAYATAMLGAEPGGRTDLSDWQGASLATFGADEEARIFSALRHEMVVGGSPWACGRSMGAGPLALFATLVAWRFYGLDGACIAAGGVWLFVALWGAAIGQFMQQKTQRIEATMMRTADDVEALSKAVDGMRDDLCKVRQAVWHN